MFHSIVSYKTSDGDLFVELRAYQKWWRRFYNFLEKARENFLSVYTDSPNDAQ
jgi:hypothetical protein